MSAPTDLCADCGHRRDQHDVRPSHLECEAPFCHCPAFDEGAPKPPAPVLRYAKVIDAELLKPLRDHLVGRIEADVRHGHISAEEWHRKMLEQLDAALVHADRIAAAEKAVIEAAEIHRDVRGNAVAVDEADALICETVDRIRAIREERAGEECGEEGRMVFRARERDGFRIVRCTKPRGHTSDGDPKHRGPLGEWEWT